MKKVIFLASAIVLGAIVACTGDDKPAAAAAAPAAEAPPAPGTVPSPDGAKAYIISPKDGDTVKGDVTVLFGLKGIGVCPAGLYKENTGHHHLLVDMDKSELPAGLPIPTIEGKCLHYGGGQTEVTLKLAPGQHTLQMVLGDHGHMLHNPPVISEKITITVE